MDTLNSVHQEPSQSYGILNGEMHRYVGRVIKIIEFLVALLQLIISWFGTAAPAIDK